jgi:hypothetical protein
MFQNVLMDPKILKEKNFFIFSMSVGIFVSLQVKKKIFLSFQFHTYVYM